MKSAIFYTIQLVAVLLCGAQSAYAGNLIFRGQNAAIFPDANPGNTASLLASTVRPRDPKTIAPSVGLTPAQVVQQSVLGQISSQINSQIFDGNQGSGTFDLGGGNIISYVRANGDIIITVVDPRTGTTTITLPDL